MGFSGITKLIQNLTERAALSDTDSFIFGGNDMFRITVANLKNELGITKLNTDTGWVNIIGTSIASADLVAPSVGTPVRYRKKGGVVYINGTFGLKNKTAGANKVLFTLPDGYRMSSGFYYFVNTSSGTVMSRYILNANGQVSLEWIRKLTDGTEMTGNIVWAGIDTCFPVG